MSGQFWRRALPALAVAAVVLIVIVAFGREGESGTIDGLRLGSQVACTPGSEAEPGVVVTCDQLIECAATSLWEGPRPAIDRATVYGVAYQPGEAGPGGWIVVFELADGGRRATDVRLVPQCLDQFRSPAP